MARLNLGRRNAGGVVGRVKVGAAWTPAALPGLAFWLKVSRDIATRQDGLAVTTVTENKGMVLAQSNATKQPKLYCGACGIGEKDVIHGDLNEYLYSASLLAGSKGTIALIFRGTASPQANGATIFCSDDEAGSGYQFRLMTHYTNPRFAIAQANNDSMDILRSKETTIAPNIPYVVALTSSGTAWSLRVNGNVQTFDVDGGANTGDWFSDTSNRDNTTFGINKTSSPASAWVGDLAEVVICNDVDLTAGDIANIEAYASSEYGIKLAASLIGITTPKPYRTFQRDANNQASIAITGTYVGTPTAIEARWNGGTWATLDAAPASNAFTGTLTNVQATSGAAQGDLEVRFSNATTVTGKVKYIGIGDVFGAGGQSNMSGRATNNQVYSSSNGYKAAMYGNDDRWKELTDPTDRDWDEIGVPSNDSTLPAGSLLPVLATKLMNKTGFPVAFVPASRGGTTVADWAPSANHVDRATLYGNQNARLAATGCRMVLMWLGENDVVAGTTQATFNAGLDTVANAIGADLSVKSMWAHIQDLSLDSPGYDETTVNAAITEAEGDNANVAVGPDFHDLTPSETLHLHFMTDAEMLTVATRWAAAIDTALGW